jgi:transposase-like protein
LLTVPPRPLAEARANVPAGLAAVVDRLRARDPAARPASAEEALALLEPFTRHSPADDPSRWDGRRRAELVLRVLRERLSAADACSRHGLAFEEFERWRQRFLEGAERALDPAASSLAASQEGIIRDLHAKIGAQAMEIEILKKRLAGP